MKIIQIVLSILIVVFLQGCVGNSFVLGPLFSVKQLQEKSLQGDREAQYRLAIYYEDTGNSSEALMWYEKSASNDYVLAQNELGNIYLEGKLGLKEDFDKAFSYYQKASDGGYYDAINNLSYMYDLGFGTKQDHVKAAELYELAAQKGSIRAMYNIGVLYKDGQGVEKDLIQAYKWFELARYYSTNSRDTNLKSSTKQRLDEVGSLITPSQIKTAKALADIWTRSVAKQ
ncbi:MAG: tetratricopeptide repeat protein [Campylobacteraceae bacterium]